MNVPIHIEISATIVAWYAAIVATIGAFVSILNFLRDRAVITIKYQRDMQVVGNSIYSREKIYFNVMVINKGRRPIKISKAGLRIIGGKRKFALFSDSFSEHRVKILTEESPVSEFLMEQDEDLLRRALYICVYDATGRSYKKYLHRFPTIWRYWVQLTCGVR